MARSKIAKGSKALGTGCAILFAIPFAAVGAFMAWAVLSTFVEYQLMQGWVETPAMITKADLQVHHDDGATYRAVAEYSYEFGGQQYQGSRVGIHGGNDNIGDFQQRVHGELKAHQEAGKAFRCFVNPGRPEQSILYRELRWEMIAFFDIFVLTFGGFGGAVLVGSYFARRAERRRAALALESPDEPWLWRDDWVANEIQTTNAHLLPAITTGAVFSILVTLPLWWLLPWQLVHGNIWALIAIPLPAIGAILAVVSYRMLRYRSKYGRCVFRLTTPRAAIGNELAGVIETSRPIECDEFHVELLCVNKVSDGEDTRTNEILRLEEMVPNTSTDGWGDTGASIPVRFELHDGCRPTGEADGGTIVWLLTATSDNPADDFKAEFEVPVFRTPTTSVQ